MPARFRFTFEKDWRYAPLAYWVHCPRPDSATAFDPPAPSPVPHRGYLFLRIEFERHELIFSSPAQLDHCIEVLAAKALPTTWQLSQRRGTTRGPNGHWLSRLPAALKSPRARHRLVRALRSVWEEVVGSEGRISFQMPLQDRY